VDKRITKTIMKTSRQKMSRQNDNALQLQFITSVFINEDKDKTFLKIKKWEIGTILKAVVILVG
jgi:hypothetical protein